MANKCPWCNSENNSKFLELKDYFLTQENFEILECNDCKLFTELLLSVSVTCVVKEAYADNADYDNRNCHSGKPRDGFTKE